MQALGYGACRACLSNPCGWKATCDPKDLIARRHELSEEIFYIRMHPEQEVFVSVVPGSAVRGGTHKFKREDIMHELEFEDKALAREVRLCGIDKECHDAFASTKEYVEVKELNGFRTLLWLKNARTALEDEHNRLVAASVASELVDEILEGMREGWYFGEGESKYETFGFVPSMAGSASAHGVKVRFLKRALTKKTNMLSAV